MNHKFLLPLALLLFSADFLSAQDKETSGMLTTYTPTVNYIVNKKPEFLPGKYKIDVKVKGLKDTSIYMFCYYSDKTIVMDSLRLNKQGIGAFDGNIILPRGMYALVIKGRDDKNKLVYYKLFDIVMGNDQEYKLDFDTSGRVGFYPNVKITGNDEVARYIDYMNFVIKQGDLNYKTAQELNEAKKGGNAELVASLQKTLDQIDQSVESYKKDFIAKNPGDFISTLFNMMEEPPQATVLPKKADGTDDSSYIFVHYKQHYWDNINFKDDGIVRAPESMFKKRLDRYFDKIVYPVTDSIIKECDYLIGKATGSREVEKYLIWYLTSKYQVSQIMGHDCIFGHLAQNYYATGKAWWADSAIIKSLSEGAERVSHTCLFSPAPDLFCYDTSNVGHRLYDVKAEYTFVVFWDPTCSHCQKTIPALAAIVSKHPERNWKVYSVSSEGKFGEWKKYIKDHPEMGNWINTCKTDLNTPWPINRFNYNVIANPSIFVLDKDKKIIAKKIEETNIEDFLKGYEEMLKDREEEAKGLK